MSIISPFLEAGAGYKAPRPPSPPHSALRPVGAQSVWPGPPHHHHTTTSSQPHTSSHHFTHHHTTPQTSTRQTMQACGIPMLSILVALTIVVYHGDQILPPDHRFLACRGRRLACSRRRGSLPYALHIN